MKFSLLPLNLFSALLTLIKGGAYNQYHSIPAQQPAQQPPPPIHAPPLASSFHNRGQRYDELSRDTIEAEVLAAQLRNLGVEVIEDPDRISAANLRNKRASFVPQPPVIDFGLFTRQAMGSIAQGTNPWSGAAEDLTYTGEPYMNTNDGGFQDGYGNHHVMSYYQNLSNTPTEHGNRNQNSAYYMNGGTSQPGMEPPRSGVSVWSPRPPPPRHPRAFMSMSRKLNFHKVQSHQQAHLNPGQMMLQRDQSFPRIPPFGLPYQYQAYNGVRIPLDPHYSAAAILPVPAQPVRRPEDYTHNLRSVLLEEFRSNSKSNKRYELKVCFAYFFFFFPLFFFSVNLHDTNSFDRIFIPTS